MTASLRCRLNAIPFHFHLCGEYSGYKGPVSDVRQKSFKRHSNDRTIKWFLSMSGKRLPNVIFLKFASHAGLSRISMLVAIPATHQTSFCDAEHLKPFDLYTFCIYEAAAAAVVVACFTETNASA